MVVKLDGGGLPDRHLVMGRRQGLQAVLLPPEEGLAPAAGPLLEGRGVDGIHGLVDCRSEFRDADEHSVAHGGDDLSLHHANAHLDSGLVLWPANPCRHDSHAVVLAHEPVLLIDDELLYRVLDDAGLAVVRHDDGRRAAELAEGADVPVDPRLLSHVRIGPGEDHRGVRQAGHEHVGLANLAGVRVAIRRALASPIDLHLLGRTTVDMQGDAVPLRPFAMALAESRVHEGIGAVIGGLHAVLAPKKRHRDPGFAHLALDPLVVDGELPVIAGLLRRVEHGSDCRIVHLAGQRPPKPLALSELLDQLHGGSRAAAGGSVPIVGVAIRSARAAGGRPRRSNHP